MRSRERVGSRPVLLNFAALTAVLSLVCDGWSGKPSPLLHQVGLLPFTFLASVLLFSLLSRRSYPAWPFRSDLWPWLIAFELCSLALIGIEAHHFARFGYTLPRTVLVVSLLVIVAAGVVAGWRRSPSFLLVAILFCVATGAMQAICSYPLNYLRSDMLPVIGWADQRLLHHLNPYTSMVVGTRIYDFPYLPGVLLAFLPAAALHLDLRFATLAAMLLASMSVFLATRPKHREDAAWILGFFLLCPFLQYRHDLYLQPHWFSLAVSVLLMRREKWDWAAFAWGVSCAIYQLSWVMYPFALLYAFRREGVRAALRELGLALLGAGVVVGPFVRVAFRQVARNTIGQWSHLSHALADPINLSYWLTYLVRPDQLRWIQASVLTLMFLVCLAQKRCANLSDTLRWMCWALAVFIPLNVLVDGYFYLTLLWMLLLFVCAEQDWWTRPPYPILTVGADEARRAA